MNTQGFRHVPAWHAVFRVEENCCYQKVVYECPGMGVYDKVDPENDELIADLLCYCHPRLDIRPITGDEFYAWREEVMRMSPN